MDEAKRFMRYVLPGLVFLFQLLLALYLSDTIIREYIGDFFSDQEASKTIAITVSTFFISGAIGYLFSMLYFVIAYRSNLYFDHRTALECLTKKHGIRIINCPVRMKRPLNKSESIRQCNAQLNTIWHYAKGYSPGAEHIDNYLDKLCNIAHGIGACIIGSIIGLFVLWVIVCPRWSYISSIWMFASTNIIWLLLLFAQCYNYTILKRNIEEVANSAIGFVIQQDFNYKSNTNENTNDTPKQQDDKHPIKEFVFICHSESYFCLRCRDKQSRKSVISQSDQSPQKMAP